MSVKTVILNSRDRVSGVASDCYIEIKNNLLQTNKKYECRLKFITIAAPLQPDTSRAIALVFDGIYCDDMYTSGNKPNPFHYIDSIEWASGVGIYDEPHRHLRLVRVGQNVIRVRFMNTDLTNVVSNVQFWNMELQFTEIDE